MAPDRKPASIFRVAFWGWFECQISGNSICFVTSGLRRNCKNYTLDKTLRTRRSTSDKVRLVPKWEKERTAVSGRWTELMAERSETVEKRGPDFQIRPGALSRRAGSVSPGLSWRG